MDNPVDTNPTRRTVLAYKGHTALVLALNTVIRRVKNRRPVGDIVPVLERCLETLDKGTPLSTVLEAIAAEAEKT